MEQTKIEAIIAQQRKFFYSGGTQSVSFRMAALQRLKTSIVKHTPEIEDAIRADLGKGAFESYMCEVGLALDELTYMIRHTPKFAKRRTVRTPLAQFYSHSYKKPSPYGVVLVMSPWNYPFLLSIDPLVDAIAAGNTVVLKPSAYSPNTSAIVAKIIRECFEEKFVAVIEGGRKENTALLESHFDYIFFTGSQFVGKEVMRKAAEHLTPVTLELGGKSPCVVEKDANIKMAAKRIVFGKFLNCGQTCVAPDYIYCHASVKDKLVKEICRQIVLQFGEEPLNNPDYGKIINEKHFQRVQGLIDPSKIVYGGKVNAKTLQIEPTVLDDVTWEDAVMGEEIFGPVLPIITYTDLRKVVETINEREHPLAFYLFTENRKIKDYMITHVGFGGGCVNDTVIHLATTHMGFGGFGESGMGSYHGKTGFDTFSHFKSVVDKSTRIDLPMRYQPYKESHEKLLHLFLK